jgi:hypothetical protein
MKKTTPMVLLMNWKLRDAFGSTGKGEVVWMPRRRRKAGLRDWRVEASEL